MYQIGILSKSNHLKEQILKQTLKTSFFKTHFYSEPLPYVRALKKNQFDALVLVTDDFRENNYDILEHVKSYFPDMPILVFAQTCSSNHKLQISSLSKVLLLNTQTEIADMNGILLKLLNDIKVCPRLKPRHQTSYSAKLKNNNLKQHTGWILNLAKDGACFRVFQPQFKKGDKIKIEITLPDLKKTHYVVGEVVWEKKEKTSDNQYIKSQKIGVHFSHSA